MLLVSVMFSVRHLCIINKRVNKKHDTSKTDISISVFSMTSLDKGSIKSICTYNFIINLLALCTYNFIINLLALSHFLDTVDPRLDQEIIIDPPLKQTRHWLCPMPGVQMRALILHYVHSKGQHKIKKKILYAESVSVWALWRLSISRHGIDLMLRSCHSWKHWLNATLVAGVKTYKCKSNAVSDNGSMYFSTRSSADTAFIKPHAHSTDEIIDYTYLNMQIII